MAHDNSVELKDFINSSLDAIERGVDPKHRKIQGSIHFEIDIKKVISAEGGIKFHVGKIGGLFKKEDVSRISFNVIPKIKDLDNKKAKVFIE